MLPEIRTLEESILTTDLNTVIKATPEAIEKYYNWVMYKISKDDKHNYTWVNTCLR